MSGNGSAAVWNGSGIGKPKGHSLVHSYGGVFHDTHLKWERLPDFYAIDEYGVEGSGDCHWKTCK